LGKKTLVSVKWCYFSLRNICRKSDVINSNCCFSGKIIIALLLDDR
jgi:hypothetical protein